MSMVPDDEINAGLAHRNVAQLLHVRRVGRDVELGPVVRRQNLVAELGAEPLGRTIAFVGAKGGVGYTCKGVSTICKTS